MNANMRLQVTLKKFNSSILSTYCIQMSCSSIFIMDAHKSFINSSQQYHALAYLYSPKQAFSKILLHNDHVYCINKCALMSEKLFHRILLTILLSHSLDVHTIWKKICVATLSLIIINVLSFFTLQTLNSHRYQNSYMSQIIS